MAVRKVQLWKVFSETAPIETSYMIPFPSIPDLNGNLGQLTKFPRPLL